ncbi:cytochrome P450 [Methylomonas sp. AM2-LC]|uniref:cytochrome P450 n=1 Tax=Methylomonas sp. AM2-LC TaxID=3153301 RepID=UPI0032632A86
MDNLTLQNRAKMPSLVEHSVILPMLQSITKPLVGLTSIHNAYGELVLGHVFNKKILFISAPEYIEQIFSYEARGLVGRGLYEAKKSFFGNGLVNSQSEVWSKQRRLIQPLFTRDAVKAWEQIIVSEAADTTAQLKAVTDAQTNLTVQIKSLIQRIFIRILLGKTAESIPNSAELLKVIDIISQELLPQLATEIIFGSRVKRFIPLKNKRFQTAVNYLKAFINQEVEQKLEQQGDDLISLFIKARDRNTGYAMSHELLQDEAVNMFFAGQDTTINTLLWFFYLTGKHAHVRNKIAAEIRLLPNELLTAAHLSQLSYTKATLNETLRLYPPTSALSTQAIEDFQLGAYTITKGTSIMLSMYATHYNTRLWERPNEFNPDRFADTAHPERHKYSFFPFGGGLHNCVGRHFAEMEMLLIIATLCREITFETEVNVKEAIGVTLKPDRPLIGRVSFHSQLE